MLKYTSVLTPFPFDNLNGSKVRTCICLTEPTSPYKHVIVAFITTQINNANEISDLHIRNTDADFGQTGLRASSAIRLHCVATLPMSLFMRQLGILPVSYQTDLDLKLRQLLDL